MNEPLTIMKISLLCESRNEDLLFGQFLDDFKNERNDPYALIKDEPACIQGKELFSCILAATAHKLANDHHLTVPQWVYKKDYVCSEAYYPCNTDIEEAKQFLRKTSPIEFVQRNVFLGSNVLSRV